MRHRAFASAGGWAKIAIVATALVLAGCGSSTPDPTIVAMTFNATSSINPNSDSEPSPVVLRIYRLKSDSAFNAAEGRRHLQGCYTDIECVTSAYWRARK